MSFETKSPEMQAIIDSNALQMYGRAVSDVLATGDCVACGYPATDFEDVISKREYEISGLCQICQDEYFPSDE